jgi:hypothetical protein
MHKTPASLLERLRQPGEQSAWENGRRRRDQGGELCTDGQAGSADWHVQG